MKDLENAKGKPEKGNNEEWVEIITVKTNNPNASEYHLEITAKILAELLELFPEVIQSKQEILVADRTRAPKQYFTVTNGKGLGDAFYMSALYTEGRLITEIRDTDPIHFKYALTKKEKQTGIPIEVKAIKTGNKWNTTIIFYFD